MQTQEIGPNNARNRANRAAKKARRNEKHRQDTILFRGPVILTEEVASILTAQGRDVRSNQHSAHSLLVGRLSQMLWLREIELPIGSRVIIDTRQTLGNIPCCEIICNREGWHRIHLWMQKRPWDLDKPINEIRTVRIDPIEDGCGGYSADELEALNDVER